MQQWSTAFSFHLYTYKRLPIPIPTNSNLISIFGVVEFDTQIRIHYKNIHEKSPARSGLPRIGTPKSLNFDRRFSVTDPNRNYFDVVELSAEKSNWYIYILFE